MQINFLEDAEGSRLTKTFTPTEVRPYPNVSQFNSYNYEVGSLEDFLVALEHSASIGRCLLKGDLNRELRSERRAGSTSPLTPTSFIVLDLDFDQGFDSIEHFLECIGLSDISYVLHHSSSAGIRYKAGLRAHIIMLLDRPISPALLKSWLQHLNLTVEPLTALCQLSASGFSLRWPLDVTTCQNDKLIYISDPICEGVDDPMAGKRFELVEKAKTHYDFPFKGTEFQALGTLTEALINDLRAGHGLPRRKAQYGTGSSDGSSIEYLKNPTRASVTSTREARGFTYLNLNGGDSWGYYFPTGKPEFLFNFKGEPVVKLRDIDPDYYQSIAPEQEQIAAAIVDTQTGWIFRDYKTDNYYTAKLVGDYTELVKTSRKGAVDFIKELNGGEEPEVIPTWEVEFDPTRLDTLNVQAKWINAFRPTEYLRATYDEPMPCPPIIDTVLRSITVNDETHEQLLHCLAYSFQTRLPWRTGWILRGTTGTGKGLLFNQILVPIFGHDQCVELTMDIFAEKHNGWIENKLFVMIDEGEIDHREASTILSKTKHLITEPYIQLRTMRKDAAPTPNFANIIVATNNRAPLKLEAEDRRWNVAPAQETSLKDKGFERDLVKQIPQELTQFCAFLAHFEVDVDKVSTPLESESRRELFEATENSVARFFRAFKEGDLQYFIEMFFDVPKPDLFDSAHNAYHTVLLRWAKASREGPVKINNAEVMQAYEFITGQRKQPANKFGAMVKRQWKEAEQLRDDNLKFRGWEVEFKVEDEEWLARLHGVPLSEMKRDQNREETRSKLSVLEGGREPGLTQPSKTTSPAPTGSS